jgi:glycosyltransferase involved in cell wall biosynthesis
MAENSSGAAAVVRSPPARTATDERAVLLIVRPPPPYGGGELVGQQLERLFAGTFSVLAFHRPRHDKQRQGRVSVSNLAFGLGYMLRSSWRLLRTRPRVVYLDLPMDRLSFFRASGIALVALALRIRVVGDLAGADFQFLDGGVLTRRYGLAVLRRLHAIRVLGESVAETLARRGLSNAAVVANGIPEPPDSAGPREPPGEEARLLYVGKVTPAKGILTLLDFVHAFRSQGRPFHLDVVGEWESEVTRTTVLGRVSELGIEELVTFHGLLLGDEKWRVYRNAHVLLHPTYWDGQPITILEALAFGVPVVATRMGAIPDTIASGVEGYLMQENSAAEVLAGVRNILHDDATYGAYSSRARVAYERRFSATVFGEKMAELLRSGVSDDGRRAAGAETVG